MRRSEATYGTTLVAQGASPWRSGDPNRDELWRYAANFRTLDGKQLGVKLLKRGEGAGELELYFDPAIEVGQKIIFSKYVHEHLLQNA